MATKKNTTVSTDDKEYSYYRITRTIGHEYKNGKKVPIKKQFYGTSKGNAQKKYEQWKEEQILAKTKAEEEQTAVANKTFGEYAEDYTYNVLMNSGEYALGTRRRYEQSYRTHIKNSFLMSMRLCDVKPRTVYSYYQGLDVSKQNLKAISKWMSAFYKWIALNDYGSNVIPSVTLPEKKDNKRSDDIVVWEPHELRTILHSSESYRLRFMIIVMNYAGLRISECLGLKYSDFKDNVLSVNRQYYRGEITQPKHKSYRKLPMHPELSAALDVHRTWHEAEMKSKNYTTDYVFTTNTGTLLDYSNVRRSFRRYYAQINVPVKKFHAYRATFCTELCRNKVPIEVASKLMGHKSVEVTAQHYALIKQDAQIEAINMLPGMDEPLTSINQNLTIRKPKKIRRIKNLTTF